MQKFTPPPAQRSAHAFERLRRRSVCVADEILAEEGGAENDASFALVARCSVAELSAKASAHQFFFIEHGGSRHWPQWQRGLSGLTEILTVLTAKGAQGFLSQTFSCVGPTFSTFQRTLHIERMLEKTIRHSRYCVESAYRP
jgi:hypothetical protein